MGSLGDFAPRLTLSKILELESKLLEFAWSIRWMSACCSVTRDKSDTSLLSSGEYLFAGACVPTPAYGPLPLELPFEASIVDFACAMFVCGRDSLL